MAYRSVKIAWLPRSNLASSTFNLARSTAAKLWSDMIVRHARLRRLGWKFPTISRWMRWAKGRAPGISAQSAQQIVKDFFDANRAIARKRAQAAPGEPSYLYPWRSSKYRDVPYTNQGALLRDGWLLLSHGKASSRLRIRVPVALPGRIMEVTLSYGHVCISCETPDGGSVPSGTVGVDLGINSLLAASDGRTAVVVNGRGVKAIQQGRNKLLATSWSRLSKLKPGSRRHKRLKHRQRAHLDRCARRTADACHKSTRVIADAFPGASVIVGKAFHAAKGHKTARRAQQVSQAATGKITRQLNYKLSGATVVSEAYSSQACPACGCLQRCERVYRCKACGLVAPRDVVGAVNIRAIGLYGALTPGQSMPTVVRFVRPLRKYPGPARAAPGSSGGTPASSSEAA